MYAVAGVAATGIREYGSDGGRIGETDGDAVKGGFFRDFLEGWSWSLHRKTLVVVLIVAALVNFGVNGIQYAIQLHFGVVRDQCDPHRIHQWRHIADDACGIVACRQTQR